MCQPSPASRPGRPPHYPFRGLLNVHYSLQPACSPSHPRWPSTSKALIASLPPRPLRLLPAGEAVAGWVYLPLRERTFSRRTRSRVKPHDRRGRHEPELGVRHRQRAEAAHDSSRDGARGPRSGGLISGRRGSPVAVHLPQAVSHAQRRARPVRVSAARSCNRSMLLARH